MTAPPLAIDVRDAIATITLDRPDMRNAIDDAMRDALAGALDQVAGDRAIRACILTGRGKAFSAGGAIERFERASTASEQREESRKLSAVCDAIEALEQPVICALNGAATGAGLALALACDLRFAAESAAIGYREHRLALIPAHGGATRLVKLIGLARAKELVLFGELVDAREAHRLGLLSRVLPDETLMDITFAEAKRLAERSPIALGLVKRLLNAAANVDVASGLALESLAQGIARSTADHREGVRAFREKRPPVFQGE